MKWCWVGILLLSSFISNAQAITTFAGGGTVLGDGGPALDAIVLDPNGGVFDQYGNYYFAEATGQRVRKISSTGIITTVAGTGSSGFGGDGGLATSALLSSPGSVILDTFGNLYIADANNERIRKVNITTGIITTICGNGTGAFYGDGGPATVAEIWGPASICFDKFGNLYISDIYNYRVRKINTAGTISTFAGSGSFSSTGTGDGGLATAATFNLLDGVISDDTGNIYIADYNAGKVRKVDTNGIITTIAGNGNPAYIGDGLPATEAQLSPGRFGFDNSENLFIADGYNRRVYKIDHTTDILYNVAGNGMTGYSGDGGPATAASIDYPSGASVDACGNLYIPDVNNKRIRKVIFDSTGTPAITISPNPNDTVCAGSLVTYSATVTGSGTFAYKWVVDGTVVSTSGSSYTYTPANGDSVRCVFAGTGLCSGNADTVSSNTVHMVVAPFVTPTVTLSGAATAVVGSTVTVTATIAGAGSSYSINWYDNGVLFATTTTPMATYTVTAGTDSITATVIPSGGCYDSATSAAHTITSSNEGVINITALPVNIYPNPAHNEVIISGSDIANITITNPIGQTLLSKNTNEAKLSIDISSYPAGIYLIKVTDSKGGKTVSKIVKE